MVTATVRSRSNKETKTAFQGVSLIRAVPVRVHRRSKLSDTLGVQFAIFQHKIWEVAFSKLFGRSKKLLEPLFDEFHIGGIA